MIANVLSDEMLGGAMVLVIHGYVQLISLKKIHKKIALNLYGDDIIREYFVPIQLLENI